MLLHHQIIGEGSPVVLIHGLFGALDNLKTLARHLSADHQVISIDVRNHGRSVHSDHMDYPAMVDDLINLLDHLGLPQVILVGHSMGGKIAMEMALLHPQRISQLVVADIAPVAYNNRHDNVFAALNSIEPATLPNRQQALTALTDAGIDMGTAQFLLKNLVKAQQGFEWRFNLPALQANYQQILGAPSQQGCYQGPTLFIKGGNSDYILAEHRPQIMGYFPNAKAKIIEGTGHWLHAEKPALFNKLVAAFIEA